MAKYVALLRAINVGGHSIIKMSDLRELCTTLGLQNISTYIQTGNIIFESELSSTDLKQLLEDKLTDQLDYKIVAFIKTPKQLRAIVDNNPFSGKELGEDYKRYVTFLAGELTDSAGQLLAERSDDYVTYHPGVQIIYTSLRKDSPKPVFDNHLVEKIIGHDATTRNWQVVQKLAELATI
ncbi:MAG TPA: DUF1697 domain-containing protein [Candidatus Nanoarchaeia archaeon]|nr:DUF1697 domain-containing protein [Candidatus Nanoarchaeia archaeon]